MLFESSVQEVHGLKDSNIAPDAVGIEIEMELPGSVDTSTLSTTKDWSVKSDGSLRNFGLEFVSRPFSLLHEHHVLGKSWADIISSPQLVKADWDCPRASVHVHVNVRDLTYNQLMNGILAYLLLEGTLVDYCGRWRKGNLFALRIPEAAANFQHIKNSITNFSKIQINSEQRYSAMNLVSLSTFGTIEFRMLGSVYDPRLIRLWASGLRHLIDRAAQMYSSPPEIYQRYTRATREEFVEEFLGELGREILKKPLNEELFEDGEEYAVEFLSASTDDWSHVNDFRNDVNYQKYAKEVRWDKKRLLADNIGSYRVWQKSQEKGKKKPSFDLGVDWVEEDPAMFEDPGSPVARATGSLFGSTFTVRPPAPPRSRARRTPPTWREGNVPPTGSDLSIYEDRRGRRWIHWSGRLPREAFFSEEMFREYTNFIDGEGWAEVDARREMDARSNISDSWVSDRLREMFAQMDVAAFTEEPAPGGPEVA